MPDRNIVRSLADTDFYKLTMMQFIRTHWPHTLVTFAFKNRTDVRLLDYITVDEIQEELDRVRELRFPGWIVQKLIKEYSNIFRPEFLHWLLEFKLPGVQCTKGNDGNPVIQVFGDWEYATLWETFIMNVVNRLYIEAKMREIGVDENDVEIEGMERFGAKMLRLSRYPSLNIADFGTRRRYSSEWQNDMLAVLPGMLPKQFHGTSNIELGLKHGLPLVGTMAHELDMGLQGVFWDEDNQTKRMISHEIMLELWQKFYGDTLLVALSDTYGTEYFLRSFDRFTVQWKGTRQDSGNPFEYGEKMIRFYQKFSMDPNSKLIVFSDGLDEDLIIALHLCFKNRIQTSFGWGTKLTNDMGFDDLSDNRGLKPLSIVVKLVESCGHPTVKLSDNPAKAMGPKWAVDRIVRLTSYHLAAHSRVECEV